MGEVSGSRARRQRRGVALSIQLRLTLWYSAVLAVSLIVFGVLLYVTMDHALEAESDRQLALQAREIAGTSRVRSAATRPFSWITSPPG